MQKYIKVLTKEGLCLTLSRTAAIINVTLIIYSIQMKQGAFLFTGNPGVKGKRRKIKQVTSVRKCQK
uniref:Uncharacterized protein n=1 Tax=Anguilla anguilla TaxID=7936 RepID=A0A0E9QEN2_ANGAN